MVAIPFVFKAVKVYDKSINVNDKFLTIKEKNNYVEIFIYDMKIADGDIEVLEELKDFLDNNSLTKTIITIEISLMIATISLFCLRSLLKKLESLFKNIHNLDTPFTLKNVDYLKNIAILLIIIIVLANISGIIMELMLKFDLHIHFSFVNIVEILIIFSLAYIFEYGYKLELEKK